MGGRNLHNTEQLKNIKISDDSSKLGTNFNLKNIATQYDNNIMEDDTNTLASIKQHKEMQLLIDINQIEDKAYSSHINSKDK